MEHVYSLYKTHIYTSAKIKQINGLLPIQEVVLLFCGNGVEIVIITLNVLLKDSAVYFYYWVQIISGIININLCDIYEITIKNSYYYAVTIK